MDLRVCGRPWAGLPSSQPLAHPVRRAEPFVGLGSLLGVVGGGVAAEHGQRGVPEEELDICLSGVLFDDPGSASSQRLEARLEETQVLWLVHHAEPPDLLPAGVDGPYCLGRDIHVSLGVDPTRQRQANEL